MLLPGWSCLYRCKSIHHNIISLESQSFSSQPNKLTTRTRRRRIKDKSSVCFVKCVLDFNEIAEITHNKKRVGASFFVKSVLGFNEIAEITHNKVLISAAVSGIIGQLVKPLTSTILSGKKYEFDISAAFQSGGFPSTHSSAVAATAMTLGLERGFGDAIFGLAVVYASLVMYDAQGVRREVGVHAKTLNKIIAHQNSFAPDDDCCSQPLTSYSDSKNNFEPRVSNPGINSMQSSNVETVNKLVSKSENTKVQVEGKKSVKRLKESVGHSETEVLAGALWGLFVSLAVNTIL